MPLTDLRCLVYLESRPQLFPGITKRLPGERPFVIIEPLRETTHSKLVSLTTLRLLVTLHKWRKFALVSLLVQLAIYI